MIPQDPSPQSPLPAPQLPSPARNKRRPYLSRRGASPDENLNGAAEFNRRAIPIFGESIVCIHLSLLYCECMLKNPDFHPSEFYASVDPREESHSRMTELLNDLGFYSRTWHMLPSGRFGAFLRQAFTGLLQETNRRSAVYMVATSTHALALGLRVKTKSDGTQELVVQVYDPNMTKVQCVARVATPQDWDSEGQTHDFLSFVCAGDDPTWTRETAQAVYFHEIDPDAHINLYELSANADGQLVKSETECPLTTNWCTNRRLQIALAASQGNLASVEAAILGYFQHIETNNLDDPKLLLEVPSVEPSVLRYIMFGERGVGQAQWEAFWRRTPDMGHKVQLLRGEDQAGDHLLLSADMFSESALCWWLGLVATLPAEHILQVLKVRERLDYSALELWIWGKNDVAGSPWPSILRTIRANHRAESRWIAEALSPDDVPLLALCRDDDQLSTLDDWATLLPEVSDDDLVFLLQAADPANVTALYQAMRQGQTRWIEWWGQWWSAAPAASKAQLLCGMGNQGEPALWTLARGHQPTAFEAWRTLWRQLPDDQRAELLAANRRQAPFGSVLHRAMTGANSIMFDAVAGDVAFIRDWGACLAEVPPPQRLALLQGSPPDGTPALWQGVRSGHWAAVVAWADCLRLVTPDERVLLTALPDDRDHPVTREARRQAQKDAASFRAALQELTRTLPDAAIGWLRALAPDQ